MSYRQNRETQSINVKKHDNINVFLNFVCIGFSIYLYWFLDTNVLFFSIYLYCFDKYICVIMKKNNNGENGNGISKKTK